MLDSLVPLYCLKGMQFFEAKEGQSLNVFLVLYTICLIALVVRNSAAHIYFSPSFFSENNLLSLVSLRNKSTYCSMACLTAVILSLIVLGAAAQDTQLIFFKSSNDPTLECPRRLGISLWLAEET